MNIFKNLSYADVFSLANLISGFMGLITCNIQFLILSTVFDGLDGFLARFKGGSSMGKELDSLADLVSFGVLPSFFLVFKSNNVLAYTSAFIYVICSALRLARFNVIKTENFIGLPVTASALILFCLFRLRLSKFLISISALLLSLIMVSTVHYQKIRNTKLLIIGGIAVVVSMISKFGCLLLLSLSLLYLISPILPSGCIRCLMK